MNAISASESLHACLENVRRLDHDRFLTLIFAPAPKRARLIALYAFNAEIARVREAVSEPMLGQIRLQWWREAIEAIGRGEAAGHEAAIALGESFTAAELHGEKLVALIDARERDLDDEPFVDMNALEAYADATSATLMLLAGFALAGPRAAKALAAIRPAGIAYALTGLMRALPLHASQGRLYLPLDLMRAHEIDPHRIFAGEMSEGLRAAMKEIAGRARAHLGEARRHAALVDRALLPALLPAALCDRYLSIMEAADFDAFHHSTEVPALVHQSRLAARKLFGRF